MARLDRLVLGLLLPLACDGETDETIAALQERVAGFDQALEDQAKACEDGAKAADDRVARLETQVATLEADKVTLTQRAATLEEEVAALQAKADAMTAELGAEGGETKAGAMKIGVPECDEYLEFYSRCIDDKLPESVRETSREALETSVEAFRQAAATPAGREALVEACRTAKDAVKSVCE